MTGEYKEISVQIFHIHCHVRNGLRRIYQERYIMIMGNLNHFLDRIDRTQNIGHMYHAHNLRSVSEKLLVFIHQKFAAIVHRNNFQIDAFPFSQQLPGDNVTMMFHYGNNHFITRMQECFAKAGG